MNENESNVLSAVIARRELVSVYASYVVWLRMVFVVNHTIKSRLLVLLSGLELGSLICARLRHPRKDVAVS